MKFTDKEKDLIEEMLIFPKSYNLTPEGVKVIKGLYKKMTENV